MMQSKRILVITGIVALAALAAAVALASPSPSTATNGSPIAIDIAGTVHSVLDGDNMLQGAISAGDAISGTYMYDLSAPERHDGRYGHWSSPYGISVGSGGIVFETDPLAVNDPGYNQFQVSIVNDVGGQDRYGLYSYANVSSLAGLRDVIIGWHLLDRTGTALTSRALPTMPPALEDWDYAILTVRGEDGDGRAFSLSAHITSAELGTVPTPQPTKTPKPTATPKPADWGGIMAVDCDADVEGVQTSCVHTAGDTFLMQVHVLRPPREGGYYALQTELLWDGAALDYQRVDIRNESLWDGCDIHASVEPHPTDEAALLSACVPFPVPDRGSVYTGAVLEFEFRCLVEGQTQMRLTSRQDSRLGTIFLDYRGGPVDPLLEDAVIECRSPGRDTDGDGCTDLAEQGLDQTLGGQRDFEDYWDYFDTPNAANVRDHVVDVGDLSRVAARSGTTGDPSIAPVSEPRMRATIPPMTEEARLARMPGTKRPPTVRSR